MAVAHAQTPATLWMRSLYARPRDSQPVVTRPAHALRTATGTSNAFGRKGRCWGRSSQGCSGDELVDGAKKCQPTYRRTCFYLLLANASEVTTCSFHLALDIGLGPESCLTCLSAWRASWRAPPCLDPPFPKKGHMPSSEVRRSMRLSGGESLAHFLYLACHSAHSDPSHILMALCSLLLRCFRSHRGRSARRVMPLSGMCALV